VCGFVVLVVMWIIAWNQIEQEPLGVAMLQTVGLLLGGWMMAFAIRVWIASRSVKYAGHFIYADAETLWECSGWTVTATDLNGIIDSEAVTNYTKEGKYQNTVVTVFMKKGKRTLTMSSERRAERLTIFLNTLGWLRSGGDKKKGGEDPSELSAAVLGGIARENAVEDYLPKKWTASAVGVDDEEIPLPQRKNRAAFGWIGLLVIPASALLLVFFLSRLNIGWRDNAIWSRVNEINDQDARAPWLRAYLADARNTRHRDDARQMLRSIYVSAVSRIRSSFVNFNQEPIPNNPFDPQAIPKLPANAGIDNELVDGLEVVLLELAELPLPDVSISVKDKTGGAQAPAREKQFRDNYAKAVYEGVGEQLIRIAEAPPDAKGMIDVTIEYGRSVNSLQATFTFTFRKKPDDAAAKTVRRVANVKDDSAATLDSVATNLGLATAGMAKPKPPPPIDGE
jgi:hypothetical protein